MNSAVYYALIITLVVFALKFVIIVIVRKKLMGNDQESLASRNDDTPSDVGEQK